MSKTETTTTPISAADFQLEDVAAVQQMLLLSRQMNPLKHRLDASGDQDDFMASRRNSMPLKKRHKASGSFSGTSTTITPELAPEVPTAVTAAIPATITTPMIFGSTGTSPSSMAALSVLLGKTAPSPDIATRLEAFKEAQRRSKLSRELLAQATKGLAPSPTLTALSLATTVNRLNSLSSLLGNCSRSGSLSVARSSSLSAAVTSSTLGTAMRSW